MWSNCDIFYRVNKSVIFMPNSLAIEKLTLGFLKYFINIEMFLNKFLSIEFEVY